MRYVVLLYRARRSEARIQQMLWKVNYCDIAFIGTVCVWFHRCSVSLLTIGHLNEATEALLWFKNKP